jgi:hypothetical protein
MSNTERFGKYAILKLNTDGFENLPLQKKHLVYHLSMSGLYGRDLFLQQNYKHNLVVKNILESIYTNIQSLDTTNLNLDVFNKFSLYLKEFWINVGIYNDFSNKRLPVHFNQTELKYLVDFSQGTYNEEDLKLVEQVLFNTEFTKLYKNIQEDGVDVVAESGGNFYENLTNDEVIIYRLATYAKMKNSPQFGFNAKLIKKENNEIIIEDNELYSSSKHCLAKKALNSLVDSLIEKIEPVKKRKEIFNTVLENLQEKDINLEILIKNMNAANYYTDKEESLASLSFIINILTKIQIELSSDNNEYIIEEIISENGLYSEYVTRINKELRLALQYTENKEQHKSIETLINFYENGSAESFDEHSLSWVEDKESEIFFINGLIESYDDPKGVACTFESIVAFKNPEQTEKVNRIIENIQWFENNMPVDARFKKDKANGLSASSVTVAGMAGATSPSLPLGICLPNSDWIRAQYGSKSVNLLNVHNARGDSEKDLKAEFFLNIYLDSITKYGSTSGSLHTDLHEVAGHGSCQTMEGVSNDDLDIYYAVIEEARADLVGLYFINQPELIEFGILDDDVDLKEFGLAQYVSYITNGSMLQLRRVELGANLAQPHLRNRQLISNWMLEQAQESKCVERVTIDSKSFITINDFDKCRELFGELLAKIQDIKSTGDFNTAKLMVETYATKVDYDLHEQVINRVDKINPPSTYGFTTPIYEAVIENGEVVDYTLHQKESFAEDQIYLSKHFS